MSLRHQLWGQGSKLPCWTLVMQACCTPDMAVSLCCFWLVAVHHARWLSGRLPSRHAHSQPRPQHLQLRLSHLQLYTTYRCSSWTVCRRLHANQLTILAFKVLT